MRTTDDEQGTGHAGPLKHAAGNLTEVFEAIDAYGDRPFWRGRLHLIAAIIAVPAGLALVLAARGTAGRIAAGIYAVSLVALFTVSASYHRLARTENAVKWFRRADHSMIFVLIAGSYTPICLVALPPQWGIPLLVVVWVTALAGCSAHVRVMSWVRGRLFSGVVGGRRRGVRGVGLGGAAVWGSRRVCRVWRV